MARNHDIALTSPALDLHTLRNQKWIISWFSANLSSCPFIASFFCMTIRCIYSTCITTFQSNLRSIEKKLFSFASICQCFNWFVFLFFSLFFQSLLFHSKCFRVTPKKHFIFKHSEHVFFKFVFKTVPINAKLTDFDDNFDDYVSYDYVAAALSTYSCGAADAVICSTCDGWLSVVAFGSCVVAYEAAASWFLITLYPKFINLKFTRKSEINLKVSELGWKLYRIFIYLYFEKSSSLAKFSNFDFIWNPSKSHKQNYFQ